MTGERLGVCPIGLHFARIEGDAKRCTKSHALVHPEGMHGGWTTNAFELVTHPIIEGAYRVGGWDAVMHMWFGTKLARYAPFLAARHRTHREARLDYLLLTGRIPRQFRLTERQRRRVDPTCRREVGSCILPSVALGQGGPGRDAAQHHHQPGVITWHRHRP